MSLFGNVGGTVGRNDLPRSNLIRRVADRQHDLDATGDAGDICFVRDGSDDREDPRYWFITPDDLFVVFGMTGLVESVHYIREDGSRDTVLARPDAYGEFDLVDRAPPLEQILDDIYQRVEKLDYKSDFTRGVFQWGAQSVLARFGAFSALYGEKDIVPGLSDQMVVLKISDGCPRRCLYCPEGGGIELYDEERIRENMDLVRGLQERFHPVSKVHMSEAFLNGSDILWHRVLNDNIRQLDRSIRLGDANPIQLRRLFKKVYGSDDVDLSRLVDPTGIVDMVYERFPEVEKLYAFMGVPTVNTVPESYLKKLRIRQSTGTAGITRVLLGIESGHAATSRYLGKNETPDEKLRAMKKIIGAGIKLEVIAQAGMTGQGFIDNNGYFVSSREALNATAFLIARAFRESYVHHSMKPKVVISRYVHVPGTELARRHDGSREIIPYFNPTIDMEADVAYFRNRLIEYGVCSLQIEDHYEQALNPEVRRSARWAS